MQVMQIKAVLRLVKVLLDKALIRAKHSYLITGFWTSPVPKHCYYKALNIFNAKPSLFTGLWTSPAPKHCYLQGFCQNSDAAIYGALNIPSAKPWLFIYRVWTS